MKHKHNWQMVKENKGWMETWSFTFVCHCGKVKRVVPTKKQIEEYMYN